MTLSSTVPAARVAAGADFMKIFLTVLLSGFVFCLSRLDNARQFVGSVDDRMRELQIEHLVRGGGSWWDMSLPMIQMPEVYVSPWSRLVDAPFVLIASVLAPAIGHEQGLSWAFWLWPPIMFAIFCLQAAAIYRAIGMPSFPPAYIVLPVATVLMTGAIWEFVPGRIDHHNMQLIALMAILHGLVRWDGKGGVLIGLGSLASVAIALEGLPFVVVAFAGLVGAFLFEVRGAAKVLRSAAAAIALPSVPLALGLLGFGGTLSTQCDAFSAPYLFLIVGFGGVLWCAAATSDRSALWMKLLVLAGPAVILLAAFAALFGQCVAGPYWMIDPVSKAYWLDRVSQEHGIVELLGQGQRVIVMVAIVFASVLACAAASLAETSRRDRAPIAIALAIAWSSLILTLLLSRYVRFVFAFVPLFLPLALQVFASRGKTFTIRSSARPLAAVCVATFCLIGIGLVAAIPRKEMVFDAADYIVHNECIGADFSVPANLPKGRIVASTAVSMSLVLDLPSGFSVAAVPFHRASPGMRKMFEAFMSSDREVRHAALAPFDYIAICRLPLDIAAGSAPFFEALSSGQDWPGLTRLDSGSDNALQLFRIEHSLLR